MTKGRISRITTTTARIISSIWIVLLFLLVGLLVLICCSLFHLYPLKIGASQGHHSKKGDDQQKSLDSTLPGILYFNLLISYLFPQPLIFCVGRYHRCNF